MKKLIRYRQQLASLAEQGLDDADGLACDSDSVLIGIPAARLLLADQPDMYRGLVEGLNRLGVVAVDGQAPRLSDAGGQCRDVYYPFVLYLHLVAFGLRYETLPVSLWGACEAAIPAALAPVRACEAFSDRMPPPQSVDTVLWQALCVFKQAKLLARDIDAEWVDGVVHQIISHPGPGGSLHPFDMQTVGLDVWTCRELCGLHALVELSLLAGTSRWMERVDQIAAYHFEHTCSSSLVNWPWAVHAFARHSHACSFADQQIQDAVTHGGGRMGVLGAMLFASAVKSMYDR